MLLALTTVAGCIYVTGVQGYEKGACEGACDAPSETNGGCPAGMIEVPGGGYVPSSKPGAGIVTIGALCVDATEVTESAYRGCVSSGRCTAPPTRTFCNYGIPGREEDPINCIDLAQARAYCSSLGKRLPTEDEWEWVARGGPLGYAFPWGNVQPAEDDEPERVCWQGKEKRNDDAAWPDRPTGTCPVKSFATGARDGIFDLSGNVWEWTSTEAEGSTFIFRGGSAFDDPNVATYRASSRGIAASAGYPGVGVRCFTDR